MEKELIEKLTDQLTAFMQSFELVFDTDWDYSYDSLLSNEDGHLIIDKIGTFLNPKVDITCCNWCNREGLLATHRELVSIMIDAGIYKSPSET